MEKIEQAKRLFWIGCLPWIATLGISGSLMVISMVQVHIDGNGTSSGMAAWIILLLGTIISLVICIPLYWKALTIAGKK